METKKFTSLVFKVISQTADFNYNGLILQQIGVTSHSCSLTFYSILFLHLCCRLPCPSLPASFICDLSVIITCTCSNPLHLCLVSPPPQGFVLPCCEVLCLFTPSSFVFRSLFERQLCVVAYSLDRLTVAPVCFWSFTLFLCPVLHGASVFVSSCRVMGSSSLPEPGFKVWENLY